MKDIHLGTIITTPAARDAIHFAIAPVTSNETLYPSQHIGLVEGSTTEVSTIAKPIGIVDPFLTGPVFPGQKFWMMLYQQTVTGMRHEWTHPAFSNCPVDPKSESRDWLTDFASKCGVTYDRMMTAIERDDYINMGDNEHYKTVLDECGQDFKKHCEVMLGRKLDAVPYPFSCSC